MLSMYINVLTSDCARPKAYIDLYLQAAHGLKSPEPVDQVRAKILAKIEAVVERPGSGAIESSDMDSELGDRCSEEQHNKNSEVNNG